MSPESLDLNNVLDNKFFDIKLFNPDYLFNQIYEFSRSISPHIFRDESVTIFKIILSIICLFFVMIIAYSTIRILEVRAKERKHLRHEIEEYAHHQAEKQKTMVAQIGEQKNERWGNVLVHLFSPSSGDWKLAIIEADSMLFGLMDQLGFKGESLGDKLKSADGDKFKSLATAWEVHTIRNRIAHEGSEYEISQHEAKRVIALYEQIFREFGYI